MSLLRTEVVLRCGGKTFRTRAPVDTGASFTVIPGPIARRLGVRACGKYQVKTADGRRQRWAFTSVGVKVDGREAPATVLISPKGEEVLLGAEVLETLQLSVDPRRGRLIPKGPFAIYAAGIVRGGRG